MGKKVNTRLTHSSFRALVIGLGILITIFLVYWMPEGLASLFVENNFLEY